VAASLSLVPAQREEVLQVLVLLEADSLAPVVVADTQLDHRDRWAPHQGLWVADLQVDDKLHTGLQPPQRPPRPRPQLLDRKALLQLQLLRRLQPSKRRNSCQHSKHPTVLETRPDLE